MRRQSELRRNRLQGRSFVHVDFPVRHRLLQGAQVTGMDLGVLKLDHLLLTNVELVAKRGEVGALVGRQLVIGKEGAEGVSPDATKQGASIVLRHVIALEDGGNLAWSDGGGAACGEALLDCAASEVASR